MRRFLTVVGFLVVALGAAAWFWSDGRALDPREFAGITADAERGETIYWAAGCASCHSAPENGDPLVLAGGHRFPSAFGTFIAPNISPDPLHGIGGWTLDEFATALVKGVSPQGQHYYPAFPYGAYANMELQDIADLKAFMDTLPFSEVSSLPNEVSFPFNIRRGLAFWKAVEQTNGFVLTDPTTPEIERGRYLVEALAHCGDCHTPRNALGGLEINRWMAGAPDPSGQGRIPGISPAQLDWTEEDIAYYLETGFTPDFDSVGGLMTPVVRNMARLTQEDRLAIAAYLKAIPATN